MRVVRATMQAVLLHPANCIKRLFRNMRANT